MVNRRPLQSSPVVRGQSPRVFAAEWRHWPCLVRRLQDLVNSEGMLDEPAAQLGELPMLCQTRTARAMFWLGLPAIRRLVDDFPELQEWEGWPAMLSCLRETRTERFLGRPDTNPYARPFAEPPVEPPKVPAADDEETFESLSALARRAVHIYEEEFSHRPLEWADRSASFRRFVRSPRAGATLLLVLLEGVQGLQEPLYRRWLERCLGMASEPSAPEPWWSHAGRWLRDHPGVLREFDRTGIRKIVAEGLVSPEFARRHAGNLPT